MTSTSQVAKAAPSRLRAWLLSDIETSPRAAARPASAVPVRHQRSWWRVMCLTGLDYFSTTGVLVLITSASVAVTLSAWRQRKRLALLTFGTIMAVFVYTTIANVIERPDGVKIAGVFIAAIVLTSVASRIHRATELRSTGIHVDAVARRLIKQVAAEGAVNIIANEPDERDEEEHRAKAHEQHEENHLPAGEPYLFLEVTVNDPSDFASPLRVFGEERFGYPVLRVEAASVANAIAAVALRVRDDTGKLPHIYFSWTEGNPVLYLLRYLFFGEGEIAPLTREVLRQAEPDRNRRPRVHVG